MNDASNLQRRQNMEYSRINKNAVKSWLISRMIFLILFSFIDWGVVYKWIIPKYGHYQIIFYGSNIFSVLFIGYLFANTFVFPFIEYKEWKYKIKEDQIELNYGVLIKTKTIIPISRIQYIDIEQGPIYRRFNLTSLSINTAGGLHELPALELEEAEKISKNLKERIEMSGNNE